MATSTVLTNKPINPRGDDNRPVDSYNRASLYSGKALDFDGVNDYIDLAGFTLSGSVASFSFYVNADGTGNVYFLDANPNRFVLRFSNNNVALFSGSLVEFGAINTNEWTHLVYVLNGTSAKCYANGVQLGTEQTITAIDLSAATDFDLGRWYLGGAFYDGGMANFKTFNTALTAAQVADLYNNPEKIVPTGVSDSALKLWLPMQEGAGTTAYDGSGNGNHGTISGATYTHGIGAPVSQTAVIDWNKPYYFDGVDDSFTTGTYQALGDRTITLSFYSSDFSLTSSYPNTLFAFNTASGGNTDMVRISADGYIAVYNGATQVGTPTIQASENELTHIAIVTDAGSETKVYVNGELSYSYNAWSPTIASTDIFNIGQETDGVNISDLWRGFIFNVGVFDSVLTQSEIQAIQGKRHADLTSAQKTNLVSFYSLQNDLNDLQGSKNLTSTGSPNALLIPQGLTSGRDLLGNLFENVRKQGALNLDGNSWAEVHDNESLDFGTGSFTLEAWVKAKYINQGSVFNMIISLGGNITSSNNAGLMLLNNNVPYFIYSNPGASSGSAQTEGDWIHLVGTYDETNTTLYVNGVQVDQDARTASDITNGFAKLIGRDGTDPNRYYNDQIAQPRIYNRALTASEVLNNYNATSSLYI